jgi:hypothetical protein
VTEHAARGRGAVTGPRPMTGPRGPRARLARNWPARHWPTRHWPTRHWFTRHWHWVLLSLWTVAWFIDMAPGGGIAWVFFRSGTAALFGGPGSFRPPGGLHLYASDPSLQIGPLSFAVAEVLRHLGPDSGLAVAEVLLTAAGLALIAVIESLARTVRPELREHPRALQLTVLFGGGAFMIAWVNLAVGYLHLDDGLALILAVLALRAVVARRPVLAGLCVGLATDAKPWALVFASLLLLVPVRQMWRSAVALLAALAAGWLPFYLADPGTINAAHYTIRNLPTSSLRALGISTARTPSWDRPTQVLLGWALGAVAVWRRRWPAVILLGVGARIALDPGVHGYYTAGIMVGALIWDTIGAQRPWPAWSLLSILALAGVPVVTRDPQILGDARLAIVVAFTAVLLLGPSRWVWQTGRRPSPAGPAPDPARPGSPPGPAAPDYPAGPMAPGPRTAPAAAGDQRKDTGG